MMNLIHKCKRSFSNSIVTSIIRNEIKDLPSLPFESHLSSATVRHRELNISDSQSDHLLSKRRKLKDVDNASDKASSAAKNDYGARMDEIRIGGRIKRAHVHNSTVEEVNLPAVGGRILRAATKAASKFENNSGSVVATMSATAKFRQRHNDTKGARSVQETKHKSNPSSISISSTKSNAELEKKVKTDETGNNSENKSLSPAVGILLLGSATGLFYSGVMPF